MQTIDAKQFEELQTKTRKSTYADLKKFILSIADANKNKICVIDLKKDANIEKVHYTTFLKLKRDDKFNLVIAEKESQYYATKLAIKFV